LASLPEGGLVCEPPIWQARPFLSISLTQPTSYESSSAIRAKAVFIARVTPLFPAFAASLLAGMAKMPWRIFLFYDFTGSIVCGIGYILIGYFFGKQWKLLEAWLGPTALYLILAGIALIVLGVILRHPVSEFWVRHLYKKRKRK
jgi:membrane-associated protein